MATETFGIALTAILRRGFREETPSLHSGWPAPHTVVVGCTGELCQVLPK